MVPYSGKHCRAATWSLMSFVQNSLKPIWKCTDVFLQKMNILHGLSGQEETSSNP